MARKGNVSTSMPHAAMPVDTVSSRSSPLGYGYGSGYGYGGSREESESDDEVMMAEPVELSGSMVEVPAEIHEDDADIDEPGAHESLVEEQVDEDQLPGAGQSQPPSDDESPSRGDEQAPRQDDREPSGSPPAEYDLPSGSPVPDPSASPLPNQDEGDPSEDGHMSGEENGDESEKQVPADSPQASPEVSGKDVESAATGSPEADDAVGKPEQEGDWAGQMDIESAVSASPIQSGVSASPLETEEAPAESPPVASPSPPAAPVASEQSSVPASSPASTASSNAGSVAAASGQAQAAAPAPVSNGAGIGSASASASSSAGGVKRLKKTVGDDKLMAGWEALLERTRKHGDYATSYTALFAKEGASWKRAKAGASNRLAVGLDCEMVYCRDDPYALARVSVVSTSSSLLDVHVQRDEADVLDFRTRISGVEASHLSADNGALRFEEVQQRVLDLISPETILVGHSLQSDLKALKIRHDRILDTALIFRVEGGPRFKHKLHSLVSIMSSKVGTFRSCGIGMSPSHLASGPHDPGQDARWSLQLSLYEASIHPRITPPLKLESFPTRIFLTEVPKGTAMAELKALFGSGTLSEIDFQLSLPKMEDAIAEEWLGKAAVVFKTKSARDAAFVAIPRYVSVYAGPFRDWSTRKDTKPMQAELTAHFSKFGRVAGRAVRGCRVFLRGNVPKGTAGSRSAPGASLPYALLECHPAIARALITATDKEHTFPTHKSSFKVSLNEEDRNRKRQVVVPLSSGHFIAKIQ